MKCPKCVGQLEPKMYEEVEIDICNTCKGIWLDKGELVKIVDNEETSFDVTLIKETVEEAFKGVPLEEIKSIELCPKCSTKMGASNLNYSSGIIVDQCPKGHGMWLDHLELEKVQIHREDWEKKYLENETEWISLVQDVKEKVAAKRDLRKERSTKVYGHIFGNLMKVMGD